MARLDGKRILVTGAAGGQGSAVARRLAAEGATIALSDLDGARLEALASELGTSTRVIICPADVTSEVAVEAACAAAATGLGGVPGIDALYNNAGVYLEELDQPADLLPLYVWERTLAVNATGAYLFCKHALPAIRAARGTIVNVSSTAGHAGDPHCHAYAASKGALIALTLSIAQRYGPEGVRAIALCPGFIETRMVEFASNDPAIAEAIRSGTALRRFGTPDEIAHVAAFLLSDEASFVTSTVIDAHGGLIK